MPGRKLKEVDAYFKLVSFPAMAGQLTAERAYEFVDAAKARVHLLTAPLDEIMAIARALRDQGHGARQTYSPKVFIPLTRLCRDRCHYCTFARPTDRASPYLTPDEVLAIAREGKAAGCAEALFTLGDKPELRYPSARVQLEQLGYASTIDYLAAMCALVLRESGLLAHVNAGIMTRAEMSMLRDVSASQGLMLESTASRLCERGGPHYRSPDKIPAVRIEAIRLAGELAIPFTSGILIGIGETREERLDALFALRELHEGYGHIQEVIVQNFRAKARTPMANAPEPEMEDLLWTIAAARLILGPAMNIQAPPNLSDAAFPQLMDAGINDWGGVSPVTPDHVNPEAPWPEREILHHATLSRERVLVERLAVYPDYVHAAKRWLAPDMAKAVRQLSDAEGLFRQTAPYSPSRHPQRSISAALGQSLARIEKGAPSETDIATLFRARGADVDFVCAAADELRQRVSGKVVTYVVNRNINYTNICLYRCTFCAFAKGSTAEELRGKPYDVADDEIVRRVLEAQARGATEVCLQGGIHPSYTGDKYLSLCRLIRDAAPDIHIHAFSPLEVAHGATTLGLSIEAFLRELKAAGLNTLPGTAAEILDDEIRATICPDKVTTQEWLNVVETAHCVGLKTTATIMFGHIEQPKHWARHLLRIRSLQMRTGGITEFVPLPFVHMEAPMGLSGLARPGPTLREVRLMHALARLTLHPHIANIQLSWPKLGPEGARLCLDAGVNDLGGTLMNESISRAAGAPHGQECEPERMEAIIRAAGRVPAQRTTLYGAVSRAQHAAAMGAPALEPIVLNPPRPKRAAVQQSNFHRPTG
jgi:FO synthase